MEGVDSQELRKTNLPQAGSLRKRYAYKLSANVACMGIGFLIQALIPRGLGPKAYGDFSFIANSFVQWTGFLDMGTSTAFYTKLSQRPRETPLVTFYAGFGVLIAVLLLGFVAFSMSTPLAGFLWPSQRTYYIFLGAVCGIVTWLATVVSQMADAYGVTIRAEVAKTIQKSAALALIVPLYAFKWLDVATVFYYQSIVALLLVGHLIYIMRQQGCLRALGSIERSEVRGYVAEFFKFCHPLVLATFLGLVAGLFDRWFLQISSGSVQQGFYGLSYQISNICFLFSSAMMPLLAREFSVAFGAHDIPKMAALFRRYGPLLCALSAFFSCFSMVQAHNIVLIYSGSDFTGAVVAVQIMSIFPIYQTYGQLTSSVLYASGQTRLYRDISVVVVLAGLAITWVLVAPFDRMGLGLGATGLALKVLATTVIGVNVQLYFTTKMLGLSFPRFFGHQVISMALLSGLAWLSNALAALAVFGAHRHLYQFLFSGLVYAAFAVLSIVLAPALVGLKRSELVDQWGKLKVLMTLGRAA
jgi:O-antigen/teichoic acid export membrane protein